MRPRALTQKQVENLKQLQAQGMTQRQLSDLTGLDRRTLCCTYGIKSEYNRKFSPEKQERIQKLTEQGLPAKEIAQQIGCEVTSVYKYRVVEPESEGQLSALKLMSRRW